MNVCGRPCVIVCCSRFWFHVVVIVGIWSGEMLWVLFVWIRYCGSFRFFIGIVIVSVWLFVCQVAMLSVGWNLWFIVKSMVR